MMLEKYSLNQKKTAIMIFGVLVILFWSINRLFLQNIIMSAIVVILIIFFFIALIWFLIDSRNTNFARKKTKINKIGVVGNG